MFSSCSPTGALNAGVKIGSGSRSPNCDPSGSGTPQMLREVWYSAHALPAT